MVKTMLQLDTIRGPHSTGLFGLDKDGKETILKKVGSPFELALYRPWDSFWAKTFNVLIGHNRYATVGAINDATAHPFNYGAISGVHNGTLKGGWKSSLDSGYTFDVDSECIYNHMAINGVDDTVKKLDGAFALVWYDNTEGTLNMTRNKERELFYCYSEDGKTIFWASEKWMMQVAAKKNGIKLGEFSILKEGVLFSTPITRGLVATLPVLESHERELEQYVPTWGNYLGKKHTTTMGSGNVTNLVPVTNLNNKVGTQVEFSVDGIDDDRHNNEFLDCTSTSVGIIGKEVRLYIHTHNMDMAVGMLDSNAKYRATIRRYVNSLDGDYFVVDPRTVVEVSAQLPAVKH